MQVTIKVISGRLSGECFSFNEPDCFLFGRSADARISLPEDPYVSRNHFLLEIAPPECKIADLGSKNGTFVNHTRFGGRRPLAPGFSMAPQGVFSTRLKDGDVITLGDTILSVRIDGDAPDTGGGAEFTDPTLNETAAANGSPLCDAHRQQATASDPASGSGAPLSTIGRDTFNNVICVGCHDKMTAAANFQSQLAESEYLCMACRNQKDEASSKLLQALLKAADIGSSITGLPSIEDYSIAEELGRGGMGVVYKAFEKETGTTVAIKMVLPRIAIDANYRRVFEREVAVTRQLRHPNIVQLYNFGESVGAFFIVLEFVEGVDLDHFIRSKGGRLSLEQAVPIMSGVIEGLAYAHQANLKLQVASGEELEFSGIVHRDLKPQNILLTRQGNRWMPKIADFGLSKSFESAGLTNMTLPGQIAGTPIYWPREQITHYRFLSPATDVFSLAAVFYEMLTGSWVRDGYDNMYAQCAQKKEAPGISDYMRVIANNPTIPIRNRLATIPAPVAEVIDRALREGEIPADVDTMRIALSKLRYLDAGEFQQALLAAFEKSSIRS